MPIDTLGPYEMTAPDPARRQAAIDAIARSADASQIAPLEVRLSEPAATVERERLLREMSILCANCLYFG